MWITASMAVDTESARVFGITFANVVMRLEKDSLKQRSVYRPEKSGWGETFVKHTQHDLYKTPTILIYDILTSVMIDFGACRVATFLKE